ncbi:iron-containing alcohol dehydrogenase [Vibrio algarum]|uniref:Iron-containing alcohol dehydrogenase n=1 Tax=Vibrio algarum TaxID=3020714 RepID=A0ABT4YQM4_9VIBR|nr:iron-containing alcohol dehydrogenase [Vibrio sp. KJ40-1]MDB1123675.1 iron-containing alcohol dehydrogenase [Vibrio sp. KJ40-1]
MEFTYGNSTTILFGQGQIAAIKKQIPAEKKVLVIYGGGSIKSNGVYDQVAAALSEHQWQEFSGVEPNPTVETMDKAVAIIKEQGIDFVLAVGGGSVIDGSKYAVAAAKYDGDGWDILIGKHKVTEAVPLAAVLTLPATGSESNAGAVLTQAATKTKLPFGSPAVQPIFAVLDPDTMKSLPERQLKNGLVDAWVHICELYVTTKKEGAMVQDGYSEVLLRNLLTLAKDYDSRDNDGWRSNLMWTANQALSGLIGAGVAQDWATHMIGHELTALYGVDHARSLAMIQPALYRNQIEAKRAKLEQMGTNVFALESGSDLAERTIEAIEAFYHSLDVATQLTDSGSDKITTVKDILANLEAHGMSTLGENQAITLDESRKILEASVA